jgi:hypothetical protein
VNKFKVGDKVRIVRKDLPVTQFNMIGKITQIKPMYNDEIYCFVYNPNWLQNSEEDDGSWPLWPNDLKLINSELIKEKLGLNGK